MHHILEKDIETDKKAESQTFTKFTVLAVVFHQKLYSTKSFTTFFRRVVTKKR